MDEMSMRLAELEAETEEMEKQTGKYRNLPDGVVVRKSVDVLWIGRESVENACRSGRTAQSAA
mgnify:CR=1 FL=1